MGDDVEKKKFFWRHALGMNKNIELGDWLISLLRLEKRDLGFGI